MDENRRVSEIEEEKEMSEKLPMHSIEGKRALGNISGVTLPIICPKCDKYLTVFKINPYCKINFQIECMNCHHISEAKDLWAEVETTND